MDQEESFPVEDLFDPTYSPKGTLTLSSTYVQLYNDIVIICIKLLLQKLFTLLAI